MNTLRIFILLTLICSINCLTAQEEQAEQYTVIPIAQVSASGLFGLPTEALRRNIEENGAGFGGLFVVGLGNLPIYAGIEGHWLTYDREDVEIPFVIDDFITDAKVEAANNILLFHSVIRFQPGFDFPLRPYADILIGAKNFYTRTTITDLLVDDNQLIESNTEQSDWVFSYGGALGLQIPVSRDKNWSIDIRAAYIPGASATYMVRKRDAILPVLIDPLEAFEEKSSPTALLLFQLGITYEITKLAD